MASKFWTISNLLSMSRALLAIPIGILILKDATIYRWEITLLISIAALTDYVDGFLARKLNQVTDAGKILDPIADKIAIAIICLSLIAVQRIPLWFGILVISRDLAIMIGSFRIIRLKKVTLQSNWFGKWTVTILAFYILSNIVLIEDQMIIKLLLQVTSVTMIGISFIFYLKRYLFETKSYKK